jgi:hypothetical protein
MYTVAAMGSPILHDQCMMLLTHDLKVLIPFNFTNLLVLSP